MPGSHNSLLIVAPGPPPEDRSVNWTFNGKQPLVGAAEKSATGFGLIVICCVMGALLPEAFDRIRVMIKVPAVLNVAVVLRRPGLVKETVGLFAVHANPVGLLVDVPTEKTTLTPAQFLLRKL